MDNTPKQLVLQLEGVDLRFGRLEVLRDITFQVRRGETVAVIGESGCGKTVLLKVIIALLRPASGRVIFDGVNLADLSEKQLTRQRIRFGFLFQGAALFDSLSVRDNVAFGLREHKDLSDREIDAIVTQRLQEVGLAPDIQRTYPAELSGGMKKRVGLARALAMNPEVLLYDEPTTGLDPIMSDVINELILQTRGRYAVTSIVVTHDMRTAKKVADRILMLYPLSRLRPGEPQILFEGTPEEIQKAEDARVRQFVRGEAGERLRQLARDNGKDVPPPAGGR
ncbi:MAG: ABC transporter ATP-binding protein [Planctomycetes bacterium]|nr:ABC transporter ATP-binding protein [Planctomycetota bacterium]